MSRDGYLVTQRDPIVLAKEVASLDRFSGGRVILGVGVGWLPEELANHGTRFETRYTLLRERVKAMKALWSGEPVARRCCPRSTRLHRLSASDRTADKGAGRLNQQSRLSGAGT